MNLLYIVPCFPSLSQTFVLNEIVSLIRQRHDVSIVSIKKPRETKVHYTVLENRLLEKTHYLLEQSSTAKLLHLIEIIKKNEIEHIHCHFAWRHIALAYSLHKAWRIPYTFTVHARDLFVRPNRNIKEWALASKKVITISEYARRRLVDLGVDAKKIRIIHCGVNVKEFYPREKKKARELKIISVGRLVEKKGQKYLVKACRSLVEKGIKFKCTLIGDGPLRQSLEKQVKAEGLSKEIKFVGEATQGDIVQELQESSVFALPCIKAGNGDIDGIPVSLMEAMAMQLPTISTPISGIPELIDDSINGLLVPPKNEVALAEAILSVWKRPRFAREIGLNARRKIMREFDIEKNIKKLVKVFVD